MHLALPIGLLLMHALAFMHTPMGHLMVAAAWEWVKRQFGKIADKARNGIVIVISKKSPKGRASLSLFDSRRGNTRSALPGSSDFAPRTVASGTGDRLPARSSRASESRTHSAALAASIRGIGASPIE